MRSEREWESRGGAPCEVSGEVGGEVDGEVGGEVGVEDGGGEGGVGCTRNQDTRLSSTEVTLQLITALTLNNIKIK